MSPTLREIRRAALLVRLRILSGRPARKRRALRASRKWSANR